MVCIVYWFVVCIKYGPCVDKMQIDLSLLSHSFYEDEQGDLLLTTHEHCIAFSSNSMHYD